MTADVAGITLGGLLRSRLESFGLVLDLRADGDGLDRRLISPDIQKTGRALAGFHEYLRPGRTLVFEPGGD